MKNQKNQADTADEREKLQQQVNEAEIELARMEEREQQKQEVQKRIQRALDQCKLPDNIPLAVNDHYASQSAIRCPGKGPWRKR